MAKTSKPVHQIRDGALCVAIWQRENDGKAFYSGNVQRAYTEDDGATWKHTDSLNTSDMPVAASLLLQAHAAILRLQNRDREKRREASEV